MVEQKRWRILTLVGMVTIIFGSGVYAQGFEWSVGPVYRDFDDFSFDGFSFENTEDMAAGNGFVTGNDTWSATELSVVNGMAQGWDGPQATLHKVLFAGDDDSVDGSPGAIIELRKGLDLVPHRLISVDFAISLLYAQTDGDADYQVAGTRTVYDIAGVAPNYNWAPLAATANPLDKTAVIDKVSVQNGAQNVTGSLSYDYDLDLWTLGAGLKGVFQCGPWSVTGGLGPTLSFVDSSIARTQSVAFNDGTPVYAARTESDDERDAKLGGYASLGFGYNLTERFHVAVGARYDWIPDEVETEYGEMDLSGPSGNVTLGYRF